MSLNISINYGREKKDTKLNGDVNTSGFEIMNIPYPNDIIGVITESKDGVKLIVSGPQILTEGNFDHIRTWGYTGGNGFSTQKIIGKTASKVNFSFLKFNGELLLISLHKAIMQCDMGTDYVLQVLKKIEENNKNIEKLDGNYQGNYSRFSNIEVRNNGGILKIDDKTLQGFINGDDKDGFSGTSEAKIIRV